jgi:hypothetical protein
MNIFKKLFNEDEDVMDCHIVFDNSYVIRMFLTRFKNRIKIEYSYEETNEFISFDFSNIKIKELEEFHKSIKMYNIPFIWQNRKALLP